MHFLILSLHTILPPSFPSSWISLPVFFKNSAHRKKWKCSSCSLVKIFIFFICALEIESIMLSDPIWKKKNREMYDLFNLNKYAESHLRDKHKWQIGGWEKKRAGYFLKYKPIFQSFLGNVYICINTTNYFNCSVNISINFIDQLNFFSILNIEKKKKNGNTFKWFTGCEELWRDIGKAPVWYWPCSPTTIQQWFQ